MSKCKVCNGTGIIRRIQPEEKKRFYEIVDQAIEKLETPKNIKKKYWSERSCEYLLERFKEESIELFQAVSEGVSQEDIESEVFDCINSLIMFVDNLRGNE